MINMLKYFFFLNIIIHTLPSIASFVTPFNHWHCIDIVKNIDTSKPYAYNIGELPLVTWFNDSTPMTTINICKHMGSKLDHGTVSNGCLTCPYHGIKHSSKDTFGKTMIFEDKLWWSYDPNSNKPPTTPYYKNKNYKTVMFSIDMNANIKDCIYNTLDINHFGFIHNNLFGQNNIIPCEYKYTKYNNDKLSLKYKYTINTNMLNIKSNLHVFSNYQIFKYPYSSTAILSFPNNENLIINSNMLPIGPNKTKWIVTLKHNFWKSYIQGVKLDLLIKFILHQDKIQMAKQASENMLKRKMMNKLVLRNEEHFKDLDKLFKNYEYPDMISVMRLHNYHNNIFDIIP